MKTKHEAADMSLKVFPEFDSIFLVVQGVGASEWTFSIPFIISNVKERASADAWVPVTLRLLSALHSQTDAKLNGTLRKIVD